MFFPENKSPFFSTKVGWSCDIYSVATYIYIIFMIISRLFSYWQPQLFYIPLGTTEDFKFQHQLIKTTEQISLPSFLDISFSLQIKKQPFFPDFVVTSIVICHACMCSRTKLRTIILPFFAQRFFLLAGEKAAFCPSIFIGSTVMHRLPACMCVC